MINIADWSHSASVRSLLSRATAPMHTNSYSKQHFLKFFLIILASFKNSS